MVRRRLLLAVLALAGGLAIAGAANAQAYPTKPVRILNGFAAGGAQDLLGRIIADHLSKALGQPFIVEAKPGAGGIVAGQILIASPADGHTLYVVSPGIIATARAMNDNMTYDPATAFAPVTVLAEAPMIIQIAADIAMTTVKDFIAYGKANPTRLNHGSPGVGTVPHLAAELFRARLGFESVHIPFRGQGPFTQAILQREVQWGFGAPISALAALRGNNGRLIAVTSRTRWSAAPDVPTLAELGFEDSVWSVWNGLVAPAGTPTAIIDRLAGEIALAMKDPATITRIQNSGYEPWTLSPAETARFFEAERARWSAVAKANNIKAE